MIIIFGIRRMAARLGTIFVLCGSCSTPTAHSLVRRRRWFTLFFVPVIPLGTKYFTTCALCGGVTQITKEGADRYLASIGDQARPSNGATVPGSPYTAAGAAATTGPLPAGTTIEPSAPGSSQGPSDT